MKCPNCKAEIELDRMREHGQSMNDGSYQRYFNCLACSCLMIEGKHYQRVRVSDSIGDRYALQELA